MTEIKTLAKEQASAIFVFVYLYVGPPQISEDVRGQVSAISATSGDGKKGSQSIITASRLGSSLCGNYGAASNHSSFCQLAPFNNTLLLCVIVFLCFEQFVIGAFILGLITATMPLFCFSMAEIGTQEDITDFGMIWMKQILISRQPGLKDTTDADQAGFTHLVIVDCSLENNIQLCSKSQLDMSRYRRGCDLRGEKAIRAKAGM